jgi:hypothetical protein
MPETRQTPIDRLISQRIQDLPEREKREVIDFIEFLKIRKDRSFIEYVDSRTKEAIEARKRGESFTSLEELQKDYA